MALVWWQGSQLRWQGQELDWLRDDNEATNIVGHGEDATRD